MSDVSIPHPAATRRDFLYLVTGATAAIGVGAHVATDEGGQGAETQQLVEIVGDVIAEAAVDQALLHVAAVIYHQRWRREPLVQAMLRGSADGREGRAAPVSSWRAVLVAAVVALALWAVLAAAPEPPPMMW